MVVIKLRSTGHSPVRNNRSDGNNEFKQCYLLIPFNESVDFILISFVYIISEKAWQIIFVVILARWGVFLILCP
ncbi:hypothetical protein XIS1_1720008 [Xenorhabdus innexi]|uniref:Uncharacterized protein n=1 Tax=Xenorhabdus innexi TaxID=290109 RepID=A0A1N6MWB1_9GAMM|nr:hypothetical protein XIS1_1720008 [Xenorhabdus innexi]